MHCVDVTELKAVKRVYRLCRLARFSLPLPTAQTAKFRTPKPLQAHKTPHLGVEIAARIKMLDQGSGRSRLRRERTGACICRR